MSVVLKSDGNGAMQAANLNADAYVQGRGNTKFAFLRKVDLAATEAFVLVDLSDTGSFPHTETGRIRLYSLTLSIEKETDGQYLLKFGVITEVDATNGSAYWFYIVDDEYIGNPTDSTDRLAQKLTWDGGIDLEIDTVGEIFENIISNTEMADDVAWQTDVSLDSPKGDTQSPPGVGDLVMYLEETAGAGTISFSVLVEYITEAAS